MTRLFNNVKTAALLAGMFALILFIGSFWGSRGLTIAFLFGGFMNVIAYLFSDKIALKSMRARQVDEKTAPDLITMS